jgi:epoxyqueuosine reductase
MRPMAEAGEEGGFILQRCRELGFARAGIARAEPTRYEKQLRAWLAAGRHGEMDYLKRHEELLIDSARFVAGAKSIICVADRYGGEGTEGLRDSGTGGRVDAGPAVGRVARYARGEDYHLVMKRRLHRLCDELRGRYSGATFRACVDTAPLLEREHAQRAGLGAVGKHTLLIERGVGSWLLLGEIVTTLELEPSEPARPDPCGSCTRCIDACPTGAITPWSVDATRCISYLTIEHRSPVNEELLPEVGDWIFGCDICQEVCPHNQATRASRAAPTHEAYEPRRSGFDLLEILEWTEADRRRAFARSALKRAKLAMMKRNALIAAGNVLADRDDTALRGRIEVLAEDAGEEAMVRETAATVLRRMGNVETER